MHGVAARERPVLDDHRGLDAALRIALGFQNKTGCRRGSVVRQFLYVGGEQNEVQQFRNPLARLCGNGAVTHLTAIALEHHARGHEIVARLVQVAAGLVHLVDRNDERRLRVHNDLDRFFRLRLHAFVRGNDEDRKVRHLRAARTHRRERLVSGRIDESNFAVGVYYFVRGSRLRDAARLTGGDVRLADIVEQRRLAMVNMAHHDDDRRTGLDCGFNRNFFECFFWHK